MAIILSIRAIFRARLHKTFLLTATAFWLGTVFYDGYAILSGNHDVDSSMLYPQGAIAVCAGLMAALGALPFRNSLPRQTRVTWVLGGISLVWGATTAYMNELERFLLWVQPEALSTYPYLPQTP